MSIIVPKIKILKIMKNPQMFCAGVTAAPPYTNHQLIMLKNTFYQWVISLVSGTERHCVNANDAFNIKI